MSGLKKNGRKWLTWGEVWLHWLSKGYDHGLAAQKADEWEKRKANTTQEEAR